MHPARKVAPMSVTGQNFFRVMQLLMSGVVLNPHLQWCYVIRHQPRWLVSGLATGQSAISKILMIVLRT